MSFASRYLFAIGLWLLSLNAMAATYHRIVIDGTSEIFMGEKGNVETFEYEIPRFHAVAGDMSDVEFLAEDVDISQLRGEVFIFILLRGLESVEIGYGARTGKKANRIETAEVAPAPQAVNLRELASSMVREKAVEFCEKYDAPLGSLEKIMGWANNAQDPSYAEDRALLNLMALWIALQGDPNFNGQWSHVPSKGHWQQTNTLDYIKRMEHFLSAFPRPSYFRGFMWDLPRLYDSPLTPFVWRARGPFLLKPVKEVFRSGMKLNTKCSSQIVGGSRSPSSSAPPPQAAPLMIERTRMRRR